jgi:hypothetical protein
MKLKPRLRSLTLGTALLASHAVLAEQDFGRIHKDVTVMSNIIKGTFESSNACRGCRPRIESNYLADQGAVFTVSMNSWRSFEVSQEFNPSSSYSFVIPSPNEVQQVEITEVVSEVLDNVGMVMDDLGERIEFRLNDFEHDELVLRQDSETRRALRDLNRERRDLEFQRREYEIEMIHANEEQRKKIEKQVLGLEGKVREVEEKQAKLSKAFESEREERERKRQAKLQQAKAEAEAQQKAMEDVVLQSLCDYGATLKNIPSSEHVSLIFDRGSKTPSNVLVMDMKDVQGCTRVDVLRNDATTYSF